MEKLIEYLKKNKITICTAESLTGGMIASTICNIAGASNVFKGGIVSYTKEAKNILLNIPLSDIEKYGVYSNETAYKMAYSIKKQLNADLAISTTGVAGPGSDEGVEAGTVYYCIIIQDKVYNEKHIFDGDRNTIRLNCVEFILKRTYELLIDNN